MLKLIDDVILLDKLDGLIHHNKKIAPVHQSMEDFLQLTDDYDSRPLAPGQKRVGFLFMSLEIKAYLIMIFF